MGRYIRRGRIAAVNSCLSSEPEASRGRDQGFPSRARLMIAEKQRGSETLKPASIEVADSSR